MDRSGLKQADTKERTALIKGYLEDKGIPFMDTDGIITAWPKPAGSPVFKVICFYGAKTTERERHISSILVTAAFAKYLKRYGTGEYAQATFLPQTHPSSQGFYEDYMEENVRGGQTITLTQIDYGDTLVVNDRSDLRSMPGKFAKYRLYMLNDSPCGKAVMLPKDEMPYSLPGMLRVIAIGTYEGEQPADGRVCGERARVSTAVYNYLCAVARDVAQYKETGKIPAGMD